MRKNLQDARRTKKYTQEQIANLLGITVRHYKALEAGTSDGSVKLWEQLSELLGETINYLLELRVAIGGKTNIR